MQFFEVECPGCKQTHKILEDSKQYKAYKEGKKKKFYCEDCNHKIRMDAVKQRFEEK